jgi:hypothetical protein
VAVNGRAVRFQDRSVTGRQLRTEAGLDPASSFVLIQLGRPGARSVGLEEEVNLQEASVPSSAPSRATAATA